MSRKNKKRLIRIIIATVLFIPLFVADKVINLGGVIDNPSVAWLLPFSLYLVIYLIIGYDILQKAVKNISHGQVFDENFLMIVATFGAFAIQEFPEAVAVMLLYQIGEFFQDLAVSKSRKEIASLMDIRADIAHLINEDGTLEDTDPELIEVGNIIRVLPGEKVPLDGTVISGSSSLDTKALTGESLPRDIIKGSSIISGSINLEATFDMEVNKKYEDSAVNKILELVENSSNVKSKQENFITKFAKWYTPIVVISAILVVLLGGLISQDWITWIRRSLNFLVVSCPCAIVISVPLSFFTSIGRAAKLGILFKGSMFLENFNRSTTYVFDKTGTLTKGNFVVSKFIPESSKETILEAALICESQSNHPIALALKSLDNKTISSHYSLTNVPGKGVVAKDDKDVYYCGNYSLMEENGFKCSIVDEIGTSVYVAKNKEFLGVIIIQDELKEETIPLITYLKSLNIKTIMLTGDNEKVANAVASKIQIDEYHASLLPQDKVKYIDELITNRKNNELITYVGDGVNDAPSLMRSDIGISLGNIGSDVAIESSDIVLMHDNLLSLVTAKKIARKTLFIVNENIYFAIGVKLGILILSVLGIASIWLAIFGDVGVALLCVLNALRSGRVKQ